MLLAKIILLQVFWYAVVYTSFKYQILFFVGSLLLTLINYLLYIKHISFIKYLLTVILFSIFGVYEIAGASYLGLVDYKNSQFSFWLLSLYVVFACYYGDVFNYLFSKNIFLLIIIGALAGPMAFYGGVKISNIEVLHNYYYVFIGLNWAIFFPVSIKLFYKDKSLLK